MKQIKPVVMIVTPFFSPNVGGVETHLDDLVDVLNVKHIHSVVSTYSPLTTVIAFKQKEQRELCTIYRLQWIGRNIFHAIEHNPLFAMLYLFPGLFIQTVLLLMKHPEVTVLHAQGFVAALVVKCCSVFFRKRTVMSTHALYTLPQKKLLAGVFTWILSGFDVVLTLSKASTDELVHGGIPANKIKRYTYWVNQNIFKPGDSLVSKRNLGISHSKLILFMGRLLRKKGTEIALELATGMQKHNYAVGIIGTGPEELRIRTSTREIPNLLFWGRVNNTQIVKYLQAADVLIVPSLYEEGMARVVMEALSCGIPVAASNRGSLPEMLTEPKICRLVEPTVAEFTKAVKSLTALPAVQQRILSRRFAEQRFSDKNAEVILSAYEHTSVVVKHP